jgi:TolA-binding protein
MRRIALVFFLVCLSFSFLVWIGCGSSRKTVDESSATGSGSEGDFDEIEKLLGISRDDNSGSQTTAKQTQSNTQPKQEKQDDLITLLEVDEGKKTDKPVGQSTGVEDKRVLRLQTEVDDLQKEIRQKNIEIADLKGQLAAKAQTAQSQTPSLPVDYSYTPPPAQYSSGLPSSDAYVNSYNDALAMFHAQEYQNAIRAFEQLLSSDMNHSYADNAQYWIGECYYAMGRYQEAIMAFEKVFTFPQSNKNDWAQFKIGQSYFKMGDRERAEQEFQQLIDNYSDSELVPRARNYLAQ